MSMLEITAGTGVYKQQEGTSEQWGKVDVAKFEGATIIQLTADGQLSPTANSKLHLLTISTDGVTAGDKIELKDGGSGGTVRLTFVFAETDLTGLAIPFPMPALFVTDIYLDVTTSGDIYVTAVYST